ncbi:MAG: type IV toxin-antitoxin system AbiEi family antitoxin domain-containing protein [Rhodoglobus sp.]
MNPVAALTDLGAVAYRTELIARGVSPYELGRARHDGRIIRVRRGWYALPDAPRDLVRAVRVGGSLTAVSAAIALGLWTLDDGLLHVSVPHNGGRLRSARTRFVPLNDEPDAGVCLHWRRSGGADSLTVQPIVAALINAIECQPEENAVILLDSALNKRLVTMEQLVDAVASLPRRYRRAVSKADGASQSGTETVVRLRLRALGIKLRIQVFCGIGYVDILVGDRLVIECHSKAHHTGVENYARDRERELALISEGYIPLTLSYEQILFDWPAVERVIRDLIASRAHLNPRNSGNTARRVR